MMGSTGEFMIFLLAIVAIVIYAIISFFAIQRRRFDPAKSVWVPGELLGFRIYVPDEWWHDKKLRSENGEYMVPVFSLVVDGHPKTVDSVWWDRRLTKNDIGKMFTVMYQPDKDILISSPEAVDDYLRSRRMGGRLFWIVGAFLLLVGISLCIYLHTT